MATFPVRRSFVGVAKETTKGTPVAPTFFVPVTKFDVDPKQNKLMDAGWRGSMGKDFGIINGTRESTVDVSGDVFLDGIGFFLAGILGVDTVTGAADPYTHALTLLNTGSAQPTSLTLTDYQGGLGSRAVPGCQVTDVTLKFDAAGLLTYDAKLSGWISATATDPTSSFTGSVVIPTWQSATTFDGSTAMANIASAEFNFKRQSENAFAAGSQDPYSVHLGEIEVTTKITYVAADQTPLSDLLANTVHAVSTVFTQSATRTLTIQMTSHYYETVKLNRGKSYFEWDTTGRGIMNATDASTGLAPAKVSILNALPTATYL